jgi:hypothetical protein
MIQLVAILFLILAAAGGGMIAYGKGDSSGFDRRDATCKVELADLRSHAAEVERQAQAEREKGRIVADDLSSKLRAMNERLVQSEKRFKDELSKRTSSLRRALDASATELLNAQARNDIRETVGEASPATPGTSGAGLQAASPDPGGSGTSERALATWISGTISAYNSCAETVRAWREWAKVVTK